MDEQKQQLVDRLKQAQNILVAVSASPSVDQLSAALGLTLALNKLNKHGTAVFSGDIPSTIEFLKPEKTIEKNTDSLRDFIIALDKNKADKLRYKVEDNVVRIFITPYKTSITDKDLQFSQGDFNVDVVIALGVTEQQDLDTAITAHGRILHDATVASVSNIGQGSLGAINWVDPTASSLSEMMLALTDGLDKKVLDNQIATALLTGIVSATERFSNDKTSPKAMSASAELMAAGANQQLIATELEAVAEPEVTEAAPAAEEPAAPDDQDQAEASGPEATDTPEAASEPEVVTKTEPGTIEITHEPEAEVEAPEAQEPEVAEAEQPQINVDADGNLRFDDATETEPGTAPAADDTSRQRISDPPTMPESNLTANSEPEQLDLPTEALSLPPVPAPLLSHDESVLPPQSSQIPSPAPQPAPPNWQAPEPPAPVQAPAPTVPDAGAASDAVTPAAADPTEGVDDARSAVEAALRASTTDPLQPVAALNAQPLGPELQQPAPAFAPPSIPSITNTGFNEPTPGNSPADQSLDMPLPTGGFAQNPLMPQAPGVSPLPPAPSAFPGAAPQTDVNNGQPAPPPVPPPMLPPLQ